MSAAADTLLLPGSRGGSVDGLILFLRDKGYAVGPSEAIDATRLVAHLAHSDPAATERLDPAWLMPKLRPVLCKRSEEQERFEALFAEWSRIPPRPPSGPTETTKRSTPAAPEGAAPARRRTRQILLAVVGVILVALVLRDLWEPGEQPAPDRPSPIATPKPEPATTPVVTPAPAPAKPDERFYGYFPAVRYNQELRLWVAFSLLSLGPLCVLGLALPLALPWLGHSRLTGRRVPLDLASLREEARRIVPPLQADIQARLERHVAGPAALRERLQRRPPLHVGRTVEATLRQLGVLSLRYRAARLRPSYLLLVEVEARPEAKSAEILNDPRGRMFYRWAERLRQQGIDVEIRLVRLDPATGEALTCRPVGSDWRLDGAEGEPLDRLPSPPAGQRLVVISDGNLLTDAEGKWRPWANRARLHRWPQRAIFTPTEPRHWGEREDALERRERPADPGFYVLPLDEAALAAWAELVVTGRLPRFTLSRAQRYPKRLRALEDAGQAEALLDPDQPVAGLAELINQLKYYLGENGYYWLAACAVPPIVRWELTLLLGEQYYLNAGARAEKLRDYIAHDYPRLALLPWLRRQFMPDWLRLALLDSLSPDRQAEVRKVVRGKLGQIGLDAAGDDALSLEEPPNPLGGGARRRAAEAASDTLYLGYLAGHSPRQLMLRAPKEWSAWLAQLPAHQRAGLLADWLAAVRDRLLWRSGLSFFGASRRALFFAGLALAALAGLAAALTLNDPNSLPRGLREGLYEEQGRGVAYPHEGPVRWAVFSPDGRRVVTASGDGTAQLWDAVSGAALGTPMKHDDWVTSAAFSPDGRRVVTASDDRTARLWDATSGAALGTPMQHDGPVHSAAFGRDGVRVLTVSTAAHQWDAQSGDALGAPIENDVFVIYADYSPDSKLIVTTGADGTARLWDAESGATLGMPMKHAAEVTFAAFTPPDGRQVVTTSDDKTARLWDTKTGAELGAPMVHGAEVTQATFSPDGRHVVTASRDGTARLWDAASGSALGAPMKHGDAVASATFSPDGKRVVTASADGTARLWYDKSSAVPDLSMKHEDTAWSVAFSPDGRRVVTASLDGTARLWDTASGTALSAPLQHSGHVLLAAFSPNGRRVVTASDDGTARLWDTTSGVALGAPMKHGDAVYSAAFSPDGRSVVTASRDGTARLWDGETGTTHGAPMKHANGVESAAFSPDGHRVVTAGRDYTARLWDAASGSALGAPMKHDDRVLSAAFSPDGQRVVTASNDDTARLWDAASGSALGAPMKHGDAVASATFSPDGRRVVTASNDGTARLWDGESGAALGLPMEHDGRVFSAAFSPDGGQVVTASEDGTARTWDAATGTPLYPPKLHQGAVRHVAFSPDGTRIVTAWGGEVQRREAPASPTASTPRTEQPQAINLPTDRFANSAKTPSGTRREKTVSSPSPLPTPGQPGDKGSRTPAGTTANEQVTQSTLPPPQKQQLLQDPPQQQQQQQPATLPSLRSNTNRAVDPSTPEQRVISAPPAEPSLKRRLPINEAPPSGPSFSAPAEPTSANPRTLRSPQTAPPAPSVPAEPPVNLAPPTQEAPRSQAAGLFMAALDALAPSAHAVLPKYPGRDALQPEQQRDEPGPTTPASQETPHQKQGQPHPQSASVSNPSGQIIRNAVDPSFGARGGGAQIWRVPPHPLPLPARLAPVAAWAAPAGLAGLIAFIAFVAITGWLRRRALRRLVAETAP
ncbi:MAG: hypothetical protein E6Q92_11020 [Burkholderiaceae bacterium]|nr:MAG: hypothetical protein E6Q92_11020 [Burkholderiaceae bacterium]